MNRMSLLTAVSLLWIVMLGVAQAGSFELQINDVSGLDEPWPLIGGLPFPEGELRNPDRIRIVDANGREVPAQIDVAATWRDGTIRWALAGLTANPQGDYRVEYGPDIIRSRPEKPMSVQEKRDGGIAVDVGTAVYEFVSDRLLPERARVGDVTFLNQAGDGAYLVDNSGRMARVAGARADVTSRIVKQGPLRTVIRRTGWYVTEDGERVARAKMWFYFSQGCPYVRMTHTLVFTENTNDLWVRDYGLQLKTSHAPDEVAFALSEPAPFESTDPKGGSRFFDSMSAGERTDWANMFTGMHGRDWNVMRIEPGNDEVYMLQENYPHHRERVFRGVIGRVPSAHSDTDGRMQRGVTEDNLWQHDWALQTEVVGDWADVQYNNSALTVVMPRLAQRFPKEIAVGSDSIHAAFWSGRSGRELDFRPLTLVNQYWQTWAGMAKPGAGFGTKAADKLASEKTNAQGAARTHELWLLPRTGNESGTTVKNRATAAARAPLVMAQPQWLTATQAIGWPMHPKDTQQFPQAEKVISKLWDTLMTRRNHQLRRTGFIAWGLTPYIRNANQHFRVSRLVDYGLRRHVWGLYARSGERGYYDYATSFNRFAGDWELAHWTTDAKRKGEFMAGEINRPFHWGSATKLWGGVTGHGITNWLLEYYLTGDEYARELIEMVGEAYKKQWDEEKLPSIVSRYDGVFSNLGILADLYRHDWDKQVGEMADSLAHQLIDLDNPTGLLDETRFGALYKAHRSLYNLYDYYQASGDKAAKKAFLKSIDHEYRFQRYRGAFSSQCYSAMLFTFGYRWTEREAYLRVVKDLVDEHRGGTSRVNIHNQIHPFGATPTALGLMADVAEASIGPFPLLETDGAVPLVFRKPAGEPVDMKIFVRMSKDVPKDTKTKANIVPPASAEGEEVMTDIDVDAEHMFATQYEGRRDLRRRHVGITVPAQLPPGQYSVHFPDSAHIAVLESTAADIEWGKSDTQDDNAATP